MLNNKQFDLAFSAELLNEFLSVAKRQKFRKYYTSIDVEDILETIQEHAEFFKVTSAVNLCRDKKDNFLLSLAIDSLATHLITGDKDLLELEYIERTKILTMTDFFKEIIR